MAEAPQGSLDGFEVWASMHLKLPAVGAMQVLADFFGSHALCGEIENFLFVFLEILNDGLRFMLSFIGCLPFYRYRSDDVSPEMSVSLSQKGCCLQPIPEVVADVLSR